jgi:hypothetical protein
MERPASVPTANAWASPERRHVGGDRARTGAEHRPGKVEVHPRSPDAGEPALDLEAPPPMPGDHEASQSRLICTIDRDAASSSQVDHQRAVADADAEVRRATEEDTVVGDSRRLQRSRGGDIQGTA